MARIDNRNSIRAKYVNCLRRKRAGNKRQDGGPEYGMLGNPNLKKFRCLNCGCDMEFWYEDRYGDYVYSCTNPCCFKSKDFAGSITVELKKLAKQQQMTSHLNYRMYNGWY